MVTIAFLSRLTKENLKYYREFEEVATNLSKECQKLNATIVNLRLRVAILEYIEKENEELKKKINKHVPPPPKKRRIPPPPKKQMNPSTTKKTDESLHHQKKDESLHHHQKKRRIPPTTKKKDESLLDHHQKRAVYETIRADLREVAHLKFDTITRELGVGGLGALKVLNKTEMVFYKPLPLRENKELNNFLEAGGGGKNKKKEN